MPTDKIKRVYMIVMPDRDMYSQCRVYLQMSTDYCLAMPLSCIYVHSVLKREGKIFHQ